VVQSTKEGLAKSISECRKRLSNFANGKPIVRVGARVFACKEGLQNVLTCARSNPDEGPLELRDGVDDIGSLTRAPLLSLLKKISIHLVNRSRERFLWSLTIGAGRLPGFPSRSCRIFSVIRAGG
jgi:hypothetical protein